MPHEHPLASSVHSSAGATLQTDSAAVRSVPLKETHEYNEALFITLRSALVLCHSFYVMHTQGPGSQNTLEHCCRDETFVGRERNSQFKQQTLSSVP